MTGVSYKKSFTVLFSSKALRVPITFFSRMMLLCTTPFLCVITWAKITQTVGFGEVVQFYGLLAHLIWRLAVWNYLKDILHPILPSTIWNFKRKNFRGSDNYWVSHDKKVFKNMENHIDFLFLQNRVHLEHLLNW